VFLDFIAKENPAAARRVIQKLFDRVDTLADFPHLDRPLLSGIAPTLRRTMASNAASNAGTWRL
jgi:plasmid stabilization system protein ParE